MVIILAFKFGTCSFVHLGMEMGKCEGFNTLWKKMAKNSTFEINALMEYSMFWAEIDFLAPYFCLNKDY